MLLKGWAPSFTEARASKPAGLLELAGSSVRGSPRPPPTTAGPACGIVLAVTGSALLAGPAATRRLRARARRSLGFQKLPCKVQSNDACSCGDLSTAAFEQPPSDVCRVCAAAFISSAKSACVHPDRKDPYLCGDCPRNGKTAGVPSVDFKQDVDTEKGEACFSTVCAAAAFVSSAKSSCVHPDRKPPNLCGDCPRNDKTSGLPPLDLRQEGVLSCAAFVSSAKSACVHPDRKPPNLCGDCPRNDKTCGWPPVDLRQEQTSEPSEW